MKELLHNVESIFRTEGGFLEDHGKTYYNIPAYQRGYKWTSKQVSKLLQDIHHFKPQGDKFYCVQNITLVPKEGDKFNVVDGQQRLTTMSLILSNLGRHDLVAQIIRFPENSIRQRTNEFLDEFVFAEESPLLDYETWDDFILENENYDHQDIYFLFNAYLTINTWIIENISDKVDFTNKLLKHVKFITNHIESEKEERVFGNLNSKRIFLDGADLVRAILITRVTQEQNIPSEKTIKLIVRTNERRVRIGWQLDELNKWWSDPVKQKYFDAWLRIPHTGDVSFDTKRHPINRLLNLFSESEGKESLSLEEFELYENTTELFNKLNQMHALLNDWYSDRDIYHYLGFLFNQKSNKNTLNFRIIFDKWNQQGMTRSKFKDYLKEEIKSEIFGDTPISGKFEKNKNWYGEDNKSLVKILLLLDIIESTPKTRDRLDPDAFTKDDNDIEHIFPQNPKDTKDKQQEKEEYIEFLKGFNKELAESSILSRWDKEKDNPDYIKELNEELNSYIQGVMIHSIGNLVLLDSSLNRSIRNYNYSIKRKKVLRFLNAGNSIQPHTIKVFSRYFQDNENENSDANTWTQEDIEANENAIINTISNYFKETIDHG
jgi:hypothetical protein